MYLEEKIRELVNHDIYAGNLVLGRSLLFTLNLPPEWQLAPGVSRPEVNAISHRDEDNQVVVNGNAWYVVFDGDRGWALEFAARIRPFANHQVTGSVEAIQSEILSVSNHPAALQWKTKRRGLPWQRHDVKFMTIKFNCPQTQRQVSLEFSGWCPQQGFEEILKSVRFLKCH